MSSRGVVLGPRSDSSRPLGGQADPTIDAAGEELDVAKALPDAGFDDEGRPAHRTPARAAGGRSCARWKGGCRVQRSGRPPSQGGEHACRDGERDLRERWRRRCESEQRAGAFHATDRRVGKGGNVGIADRRADRRQTPFGSAARLTTRHCRAGTAPRPPPARVTSRGYAAGRREDRERRAGWLSTSAGLPDPAEEAIGADRRRVLLGALAALPLEPVDVVACRHLLELSEAETCLSRRPSSRRPPGVGQRRARAASSAASGTSAPDPAPHLGGRGARGGARGGARPTRPRGGSRAVPDRRDHRPGASRSVRTSDHGAPQPVTESGEAVSPAEAQADRGVAIAVPTVLGAPTSVALVEGLRV